MRVEAATTLKTVTDGKRPPDYLQSLQYLHADVLRDACESVRFRISRAPTFPMLYRLCESCFLMSKACLARSFQRFRATSNNLCTTIARLLPPVRSADITLP